MDTGLTLQFKAIAVNTPASTQNLFNTGNVPGMAQSKRETFVFTGLAKLVDEPENNLVFDCI